MKTSTALTFSQKEIDYIKSQRLARIATASKKGDPDVAPVGFDFDGIYFYVGGHILARTFKYRNILENPRVSLVIDDLASIKPWTPRSLKIRGKADLVDRDNGYVGPGKYIRVKPTHKATININEQFKYRQSPKDGARPNGQTQMVLHTSTNMTFIALLQNCVTETPTARK